MRALKVTGKIIIFFFLLFFFLSTLVYYKTVIYHFPEIKKFNGGTWYNPYKNISHRPLKANFHTHAIAWRGITNGKDEPDDMIREYHKHGYDVISISNYHTIYKNNIDSFFIPAYEHGYNMGKTHYNVLGAERVSFFDYPFFQLTSHKQQIINTLQRDAQVLVINHPAVRNGFTLSDMKRLQHYQLIEVWNPFGRSEAYWDAALSSGHTVFLLANDDAHSLEKGSFKMWNMIYSVNNKDSIYKALLAGNHYGVRKINNNPPPFEFDLFLSGDSLFFSSTINFDSIQLITDDGFISQSNYDTSELTHILNDSVTYARLKLIHADFEVLLNPVIRYDGSSLDTYSANTISVDTTRTILFRIGLAVFQFLILYGVLRILKVRIPIFKSRWARKK